jgi:hypothetical protein
MINIAIDFDGTLVSHEFPLIGNEIGSVPIIKKLVANGHNIILFTMRSDVENVSSDDYNIHNKPGNYLTDAVNWCKSNDIPLYGINTNPTQNTWTKSPKAYANLYIDDAALGCPLMYDKSISNRPFVNWIEVEKMLINMGLI